MSIFKRKPVEKIDVVTETRIVEVVKPIPGEASRIDLYRAYSIRTESTSFRYAFASVDIQTTHGYFLSCKDAFEKYPDCKVERKDGIKIGDVIFIATCLKEVKVEKVNKNKPKARASGNE